MHSSTEDVPRSRAAKVSASSDTMEDYLSTRTPPVRETGLDECFVVLQPGQGPAAGLLTVSPGNKLVHVRSTSPRFSSGDSSAHEDASYEQFAAESKTDSAWA